MKGETMNNNIRNEQSNSEGEPRAVIYVRSAAHPRHDPDAATNVQEQYQACRAKAKSLGAVIEAEYSDIGASGLNLKRPGSEALMRRLEREPQVDYLIVHRLDRLTRSLGDHVQLWRDF